MSEREHLIAGLDVVADLNSYLWEGIAESAEKGEIDMQELINLVKETNRVTKEATKDTIRFVVTNYKASSLDAHLNKENLN
jgi:predicted DNA-binding ribbon-helix-helix protein